MKESGFSLLTRDMATHLQMRRAILVLFFVSVITNAFLAGFIALKKDETKTVILSPKETVAYIASSDAVSENLLERFAIESLDLVMNMTPASAPWQVKTFLSNVAPESYSDIKALLEKGRETLKRNEASIAFFPTASRVDAKEREVCLRGTRKTIIAKTVTGESELSACLELTVRSGRLWITALNVRESTKSNPFGVRP